MYSKFKKPNLGQTQLVFLKQPNYYCYRFEPDMLAFSGCYYGGGDKERKELGAIRKRWKTLHVRLN